VNTAAVLQRRLDQLGLSHRKLAELVAGLEHRPAPASSSWWWVNRPDRLRPPRIRSIELALQLPPGALIELLGGPTRAEVAHGAGTIPHVGAGRPQPARPAPGCGPTTREDA
jgi:hypothetical protein